MNAVGTWLPLIVLAALWLVLTRLGKASRAQAHELVAAGAILLDVRSEAEFASGHLPAAVNVPVGQLPAQASSLASAGKPIVVYCASGVRSAGAKRILQAAGAKVHDLGAMHRW